MLKPVGLGLKAVGVDPDTVSDVIITHMHYDHAGNSRPPAARALPRAGLRNGVRDRSLHVPPPDAPPLRGRGRGLDGAQGLRRPCRVLRWRGDRSRRASRYTRSAAILAACRFCASIPSAARRAGQAMPRTITSTSRPTAPSPCSRTCRRSARGLSHRQAAGAVDEAHRARPRPQGLRSLSRPSRTWKAGP
jgi:hypothetical protein